MMFEAIFQGSWYHQRDLHGSNGPLGWSDRFLQLNYRSGMVVHTDHADIVLLPCSWKVLHGAMASNRDWSDFNHHSDVLHRVSPNYPATRCCAHCRRGVWLHNHRRLWLFWISEVYSLEKWRTRTGIADKINDNHGHSSFCFPCLEFYLKYQLP